MKSIRIYQVRFHNMVLMKYCSFSFNSFDSILMFSHLNQLKLSRNFNFHCLPHFKCCIRN